MRLPVSRSYSASTAGESGIQSPSNLRRRVRPFGSLKRTSRTEWPRRSRRLNSMIWSSGITDGRFRSRSDKERLGTTRPAGVIVTSSKPRSEMARKYAPETSPRGNRTSGGNSTKNGSRATRSLNSGGVRLKPTAAKTNPDTKNTYASRRAILRARPAIESRVAMSAYEDERNVIRNGLFLPNGGGHGPGVQTPRHRGGRPRGRGRQVVREGRGRRQGERSCRRGHDGQGDGADPLARHGQDPAAAGEGRRGRESRLDARRLRRSGGGRAGADSRRRADGIGDARGPGPDGRTAASAVRSGGGPRGPGGPSTREGAERRPRRGPRERAAGTDHGGRRAAGDEGTRRAHDTRGPRGNADWRRGTHPNPRPAEADLREDDEVERDRSSVHVRRGGRHVRARPAARPPEIDGGPQGNQADVPPVFHQGRRRGARGVPDPERVRRRRARGDRRQAVLSHRHRDRNGRRPDRHRGPRRGQAGLVGPREGDRPPHDGGAGQEALTPGRPRLDLHDHVAREGRRHPRDADHQLARGRDPRHPQDRETARRAGRPRRHPGH